jgi:hypothetical protein
MLFHEATKDVGSEKPSFLDLYEQEVLFDSPKVDGTPTSKVDPKIRAKEHLDYLQLASQTLVAENMEQLLKTISSQAFVTAYFEFDLKLTLGLIPESLAHDPVGH